VPRYAGSAYVSLIILRFFRVQCGEMLSTWKLRTKVFLCAENALLGIFLFKTTEKLNTMAFIEAGPGRPKGLQNKQTVAIKDAIQNAFTELGGAAYLVHVGRTDPRTFCALLSRLLPTKLANADGSPLLAALTELTDAQLEARTARALADAQRLGIAATPTQQVIEVQAETVAPAQSVSDVTDPAHHGV